MNQGLDYQTYLASREWAVKKNLVRQRSGGICERCHLGPHEQTHHLTYKNIGNEPLEDLQGVCRPCHEYLSAKSEFDPLTLVPEGSGDVVESFRTYGENLPLKTDAFDSFNRMIRSAIQASAPPVQVQLAQLMLDVNRRFYNARRMA